MDNTSVKIGAILADLNDRQIRHKDMVYRLEPRVNDVLCLLVAHKGQVVDRDLILQDVYQGQIVSYSAINRLIAKLRKVFSELDPTHDYIETIPKKGFKLIAHVELFDEEKDDIRSLSRFSNFSTLKRYVKSFPLLAVVFTLFLTSFYQLYANGNDSKPMQNCMPVEGWDVKGSNPDDFVVCVDSDVGIPAPSAFITQRIQDPHGFVAIMQKSWKEEYRNKRVRFSAKVKTVDMDGELNLFLRADKGMDKSPLLAFINTEEDGQAVVKDTDWRYLSLELNIPETANALVYGAFLKKNAKVWVDDFNIEIIADLNPFNRVFYQPQKFEFKGQQHAENWYKPNPPCKGACCLKFSSELQEDKASNKI